MTSSRFWRTVGPQLENLRLGLIKDAENAITPPEVQQVRAIFEMITEGL